VGQQASADHMQQTLWGSRLQQTICSRHCGAAGYIRLYIADTMRQQATTDMQHALWGSRLQQTICSRHRRAAGYIRLFVAGTVGQQASADHMQQTYRMAEGYSRSCTV
jgi:hypothetical protein